MYGAEDIHGWCSSMYVYNPEKDLKICWKRNEELKEENQKLKDEISTLKRLDKENNINIIDGHVCYRELSEVDITNIDMNIDEKKLYLNLSGKVIYKDVDTHEIIAVRHIDNSIGENEKCTEI
jgi:hypothetical protein